MRWALRIHRAGIDWLRLPKKKEKEDLAAVGR
jgi:hypothetical protein